MIGNSNTPDVAVLSALVARLSRAGINVGGTAGYPRIECHSGTASQAEDKSGLVRKLTVSVESMTDNDQLAAMALSDENAALLESPLELSGGWRGMGQILTQGQVMPEASDTKNIIYRSILTVEIYAEKTNDPGSGSGGAADGA